MNSQTIREVLFPILLGATVVWFVLAKLLFHRLEEDHPQKYDAMGRPSLFLRNNLTNNWKTLRFLVVREHRELNDGHLSKLSDAMLVFLVLYLLLLSCSFLLLT